MPIFTTNAQNESPLWHFLNSDLPFLDSILIALVTTIDKIRPIMVLTYSNLRFAAFSVLFISVATSAAFFIFPLLLVSFICSGFVLIFTGLSYSSFRVASSQYNHTVLFLNRILRNIADSIPPSVGYSEIKPLKIDSGKMLPAAPHFNILSNVKSTVKFFIAFIQKINPFKRSAKDPKNPHLIEEEEGQPHPDSKAVIVVDEEPDKSLEANLKGKAGSKLDPVFAGNEETDAIPKDDLNGIEFQKHRDKGPANNEQTH